MKSTLIIKPIMKISPPVKSIKVFLKNGLLLLLVFTFSACGDDDQVSLFERNWRLTWEDDFEGTAGSLPNPANWVYDLGRGPNGDGWGNMELQNYTNNPENVSLDGQGNLAITAISEGGSYTSARIKTKGLFEQTYGRVEARIKLPYGPGIWPAFWMLGANIDEVPWPGCGEIDIMEFKGQEPNVVHGTIHGPGYSKDVPISKSFGFEDLRLDLDFHIYAIDWDEESINFFVDDILYFQVKPNDLVNRQLKPRDASGEWVFDRPFFILLNVAVGGTFVGFPTRLDIFPQTMLIDYVRVYEEVDN